MNRFVSSMLVLVAVAPVGAMDRDAVREVLARAHATGDPQVTAAVHLLVQRGVLTTAPSPARPMASGRAPAPGDPKASGGVYGEANGQPVELQVYANGVFGRTNGQDVSLQTYANGVFGQANGKNVSLSTYTNGVFGEANGHSVSLNVYGGLDVGSLALAVALSIPWPSAPATR